MSRHKTENLIVMGFSCHGKKEAKTSEHSCLIIKQTNTKMKVKPEAPQAVRKQWIGFDLQNHFHVANNTISASFTWECVFQLNLPHRNFGI